MKKHLLSGILGVAAAAVMTVSAFASETVDDVLSKYQEASQSVSECNADVDMKADVAISLPDANASFGLTGNGTMAIAMKLDPLAVSTTASLSGEAMGEGGSMDLEMYIAAKDDGAIGIYFNGVMGDDASGWQYQEVPAENASQILDLIKNPDQAAIDLPFTYTLGDGTVDVNGHECYQLLTTITWSELQTIINTAMEQAAATTGEELDSDDLSQTLELAGMFLSGIRFNMEIDVDTTDYLPMRAHLDTEGSDWTILGALFAQYADMTNEDGSLMNVEINVNDLYIDYTYDYSAPVEITIPEEAIASEANGSVLDDDAAEDLLGGIGIDD